MKSQELEKNINPSVESMTALGSCLNGSLSVLQGSLRLILVAYALCISGVFALFANRRAEGSLPLSALFISTSIFFNVFGAMMFGKRVGGFLSESWNRAQQKDLIYLSFWFVSLGLAGMTAMAGVKISEDSVSILSHQVLIKAAVGMFAFNSLSTRWVGGLDLLEKMYKEIRYNDFDRFFQDWKKYDGAAITDRFLPNPNESAHTQLITYFYNQLSADKKSLSVCEEILFYTDKMLKMFLGVISLPLLPMWISLTAKGLKAIKPEWEASAPFTISCAFSNLPFYFLSCFNLYPNTKLLLEKLADRFDPSQSCVRNASLTVGFFVFLALAIVSGGGYGMEVKSMVQNGYGKTAHDVFPNAFFDVTNVFASDFAMVIAGLVNFANTAKFFADVLKLQADNAHISFLKAMVCYMNLVQIPEKPVLPVDDEVVSNQASQHSMGTLPPSAQASTLDVDDGATTVDIGDEVSSDVMVQYHQEEREKLVADMKAALSANRFNADNPSALSVDGAAIPPEAIKVPRFQWCFVTSRCGSWGSGAPKETAREAQLAEGLLLNATA